MNSLKSTQNNLLHQILRHKSGLTIGALAKKLKITRNAVRQHIRALENAGFVTCGAVEPTGGRPKQLYVLTEEGRERFPRQYSWLAELLLESLHNNEETTGIKDKLASMGRQVGAKLKAQLPATTGSPNQIDALARGMSGLGYDAVARTKDGKPFIEAYNCVFHKLAEKNSAVCQFDLALLSTATGCEVEHSSCMVRGGASCQFRFCSKKNALVVK